MTSEFLQFRIRLWGVLTAGATLTAAVSIAGFFGRYAWWLDIWSHFRVQYAAGFAVLGLCCFLGKRQRLAAAALCAAVLNAVPVIAFLLPSASRAVDTGEAFRAIFINVSTQAGDPAKVLSFIAREDPDIVVLAEIDDAWVTALASLFEHYEFRAIEPRSDNFGLVLLSRLETTSVEVVLFGAAQVPSLVADIRAGGRVLTLIATHPLPPSGPLYSALRNEQLELIAHHVRATEGPVLLLGDLNTTPWSAHYHAFMRTSGLENASRGRGLHPTWPAFAPPLLIPLDYALHSDAIDILNKAVGSSVGSDHYPIIVDFAVLASREEEGI